MRLLWGNWPGIISHVESISVCALSLVIWPLESILFIPSTFCWQRHRHLCPHTCFWSPLCGERKLLTYRGKEVVVENTRENQVCSKSSFSPLLRKLGQKREMRRNSCSISYMKRKVPKEIQFWVFQRVNADYTLQENLKVSCRGILSEGSLPDSF